MVGAIGWGICAASALVAGVTAFVTLDHFGDLHLAWGVFSLVAAIWYVERASRSYSAA